MEEGGRGIRGGGEEKRGVEEREAEGGEGGGVRGRGEGKKGSRAVQHGGTGRPTCDGV